MSSNEQSLDSLIAEAETLEGAGKLEESLRKWKGVRANKRLTRCGRATCAVGKRTPAIG